MKKKIINKQSSLGKMKTVYLSYATKCATYFTKIFTQIDKRIKYDAVNELLKYAVLTLKAPQNKYTLNINIILLQSYARYLLKYKFIFFFSIKCMHIHLSSYNQK